MQTLWSIATYEINLIFLKYCTVLPKLAFFSLWCIFFAQKLHQVFMEDLP